MEAIGLEAVACGQRAASEAFGERTKRTALVIKDQAVKFGEDFPDKVKDYSDQASVAFQSW